MRSPYIHAIPPYSVAAATESTVAAGSDVDCSAIAVTIPTGKSTIASTSSAVNAAMPPTQPCPGFDASGLRRSGNAYGAHTETRLPIASTTPSMPGARPSVIGRYAQPCVIVAVINGGHGDERDDDHRSRDVLAR